MVARSVVLEKDVVIHHPDLVNLYGCRIGEGSRIGTFVEIQRNASVGRHCKISSHPVIGAAYEAYAAALSHHRSPVVVAKYVLADAGRPGLAARTQLARMWQLHG